jgi:glycerol-3-phosphate dehydrogenase (NAD(P)+)
MVAEGINTTRSVHDKAERMGISMPIAQQAYRVLYEGKDARAAVTDLMLREPRHEG